MTDIFDTSDKVAGPDSARRGSEADAGRVRAVFEALREYYAYLQESEAGGDEELRRHCAAALEWLGKAEQRYGAHRLASELIAERVLGVDHKRLEEQKRARLLERVDRMLLRLFTRFESALPRPTPANMALVLTRAKDGTLWSWKGSKQYPLEPLLQECLLEARLIEPLSAVEAARELASLLLAGKLGFGRLSHHGSGAAGTMYLLSRRGERTGRSSPPEPEVGLAALGIDAAEFIEKYYEPAVPWKEELEVMAPVVKQALDEVPAIGGSPVALPDRSPDVVL